jgi:hypothetical protein
MRVSVQRAYIPVRAHDFSKLAEVPRAVAVLVERVEDLRTNARKSPTPTQPGAHTRARARHARNGLWGQRSPADICLAADANGIIVGRLVLLLRV